MPQTLVRNSTLTSWLLHHLDEESLKGFEKVDQEPLDGGIRWLIEYKGTRRKRHRIPDVLDGKGDVVEDGLALEKLDEPRLRLGDNEFDHRKPGRESNTTLKGRHRSPDQRLIILKSLPAQILGDADRPHHHADVMEFHDAPLGKPPLKKQLMLVVRWSDQANGIGKRHRAQGAHCMSKRERILRLLVMGNGLWVTTYRL